MKQVTLALVGAGQRGMDCHADYALKNPHEVRFVAVAEPDLERRNKFQRLHSLPDEQCFISWQSLLAQPKLADAIVICTQDKMHFAPTMAALNAGYHVLLEKPMSPDPQECIKMSQCADENNRILSICHVLRYTSFFSTIKQLLDQNEIGRLMTIQHNESVAFWHYAHSFVRGNWRNANESSPMILAKSCHDMDMLLWLAGADCVNISSFGMLSHFTAQNAPADAPTRCLDGCPVANTCPYYAPKYYLTTNTGWPASIISNDPSLEARLLALQVGPYGRCVYHCDNNVVDHQIVHMEFANEVVASFTMSTFTNENGRSIKLMGTAGEIWGTMEKYEIGVFDFSSRTRKIIQLDSTSDQEHGGGDIHLMRDFVRQVQHDGQQTGLTSAQVSVKSHLMAFAAEKSRLEKKTIYMKDFYKSLNL